MINIKVFRTTIFLAVITASSSLFAQVKIGSNPTIIDPTNNLEVESSTVGNKVSINKTTGKITIADGSQGDAKVLTSNANGVATWQPLSAQNSPVMLSARQTTSQYVPANGYVQIDFNTAVFDKGSNFNLSNDRFIIPSDGYYIITLSASNVADQVVSGYAYGHNLFLFKNGSSYRLGAVNVISGGQGQVSSFTTLVYAKAGDYFSAHLYSNAVASRITDCWFDAYKVSE